ncbi:MAG: ATP-binding protein [Pseudomonadota bacterium]
MRQTLMLGAGLGIFLPALLLTYFQTTSRLETEVNQRVRVPMQLYSDVLSRGLAIAIWTVDKDVTTGLTDAVMRNPDVVSVTVRDEFQKILVHKKSGLALQGTPLIEKRSIVHEGLVIGYLELELTTARIQADIFRDIAKQALALVAQLAISFALIWLLFDWRMMRPLRALQADASRLARGELTQPLQWRHADELGTLAQGLDHMRTELSSLIAERDQKNDALTQELLVRRRTEAALSVSQAKFLAIFDGSPVAISVSQMGGAFTILDVNGAWERLFGRSRDAILGTNGSHNGMWVSQDVRQEVLQALDQKGVVSRHQAWMQPGDGRPSILCEISGQVLAMAEHAMLILAYEDVTDKHQHALNILGLNATLERRVGERTQELSEALAQLTTAQSELVRKEKLSALGSLVAGVAHELNTPVGNSLTVASTLQEHVKAFTSDVEKGITRSRLNAFLTMVGEGSDILMHSLHRAAELVASFKQVAVDQASVNRRVFQLDAAVAEILLTLGPSIRKAQHTVHSVVPAGITMDSYPGPLAQILTNLIGNALLHAFDGHENGVVTLSVRQLDDAQVELTVSDNGGGIPMVNLTRVFDPFFTTKFGQGGSGLGLNIVYNLVTGMMGGDLKVDSPPGQGACFTITLPLVAPAAAPEVSLPTLLGDALSR